ncbi:Poly-beta-hydroxybutyrate polymerase [Rickettsiales bacterium Ac37b]|nr:Poly-beta-hydroxybutyrate polymerase [Rickettsiales bacterium Ac37b]
MIDKISGNFFKILDYYQKILQVFLQKQSLQKDSLTNTLKLTQDFLPIIASLISDPEKLLQYQLSYTEDYLNLLNATTKRFMNGDDQETIIYQAVTKDNRFKDTSWDENTFFYFIKQSYFMTSTWISNIIYEQTKNLDKKTARKIQFYTKQILDALSPSNFALINPLVLKETIESQGDNIVKGMENFLKDLERSNHLLDIQTSDPTAFKLGYNIATTKGKVIFQNDLMQLIHYAPLQKHYYSIPLLIIPPCINKYYIFDLREKNSFIRWLLMQGYNVFLISWVNPDKNLANKDFEDYMLEGPVCALDMIEKAIGAKKINMMGYCIGGTLLASTLAYLEAKQDKRVQSASFLTTLLDFAEAGDISIFIDDEQLNHLEKASKEDGYFDGITMSTAFSLLRANDMIWNFFVNNYLLGKLPLPFDLLYWNADSTRLPAKMHNFFLRNMYQQNLLSKPGALTLSDVKIDLSTIQVPCYFLSTRDDHLAPWQSTYLATKLLNCPVTFVLSASGHVAGVINHPDNNKYCYWKNNNYSIEATDWLNHAKEFPGSWWQDWHQWNSNMSGKLITSKALSQDKLLPLEDAPGSYAKMK